jgi:hypothetical protein
LTPVFDSEANLVAWFDGANVFDLEMNWVAFHSSGHLFSPHSVTWLGPFSKGSFLDRSGKPVAWLGGSAPSSTLKPLTPLRPLKPLAPLKPLKPLTPLRPLKPLAPIGGWSPVPWNRWINTRA